MASQQSKIILYLIILLGLVGGYLYNSQFDPAEAVPAMPVSVTPDTLSPLGSVKVNYSALKNAAFEELRIFGEFPVPTFAPGKRNPFQ